MDDRLLNIWNKLYEKLYGWTESLVVMLPNFVVAVLVLLLFALTGAYFKRLTIRIVRRFSDQISLQNLLGNSIRVLTILMGLVIALEFLHLNKALTSLLAGAGIIGLAISFAFQDLAQNLVSGLYLAINRPIRVGDFIEAGSHFGQVSRIGIRTSVIRTFDGQDLHLPNKYLFQDPVQNYSTGARRILLRVGVSYGEDLQRVEEVTLAALAGLENLHPDKETQLFYEEFGDSAIVFRLHIWVPFFQGGPYFGVRSEAIKAIHHAYKGAGITIPFPIRTLDFGIKGGETLTESLRPLEMVRENGNGSEN
jgi:small conductance mechanosensitive channel